MKAWVYTKYGSADGLRLEEVAMPTPRDDEVLIRSKATSINASDVEFLTGSPLYTRAWGLRRPKHPILGSDIAGLVEGVGSAVTGFREGDAVFGDVLGHWGGLAEFACAPAEALRVKPEGLTFVEAASLPQAACVALQGIRDAGAVQAGQAVLINGAGGGSGSFALQIARHLGAEVTGVDSITKHALMRSLGAAKVIDYAREDFTASGQRYDLILDFVASHSIFDYRRALRDGGRYVMVGGDVRHLLSTLTAGSLLSLFGSRKMKLLAAEPNGGLEDVTALIAAGALAPIIETSYPFAEAPEALRHVGEGRALGKIVVSF